MGAEQLRPAVRPSGVGVHNAPGQLHQLADVAHQQDGGEPLRSGSVQGLPDEVGAADHRDLRGQGHTAPGQELHAVVPGGEHQLPGPAGSGLPQLQGRGLHDGLDAHGFHNAGGTQN